MLVDASDLLETLKLHGERLTRSEPNSADIAKGLGLALLALEQLLRSGQAGSAAPAAGKPADGFKSKASRW